MYNLAADLANNLKVYTQYINAQASVSTLVKLDVPMVGEMYMDTTPPVGATLNAQDQSEHRALPIAFASAEFEETVYAPFAAVTYSPAVVGDVDLLGEVNDRLKTQARRYPHPLTNEMEVLG